MSSVAPHDVLNTLCAVHPFSVACTRLYNPLCPSVGRLVGRLVTLCFFAAPAHPHATSACVYGLVSLLVDVQILHSLAHYYSIKISSSFWVVWTMLWAHKWKGHKNEQTNNGHVSCHRFSRFQRATQSFAPFFCQNRSVCSSTWQRFASFGCLHMGHLLFTLSPHFHVGWLKIIGVFPVTETNRLIPV